MRKVTDKNIIIRNFLHFPLLSCQQMSNFASRNSNTYEGDYQ